MFGDARWPEQLVLTRNRPFTHGIQLRGLDGGPVDFPAGFRLFFEIQTDPLTVWDFTVSGCSAWVEVPAEKVNAVPPLSKWQLVWASGGKAGVPVALGSVVFQP